MTSELGPEARHQLRVDQHGRRDQRAPLFHLVDDPRPLLRQLEFGWPIGVQIRHDGLDNPVDPEGALPVLGSGHEVPDVVLVGQAPRIDESLRARPRSVGVHQPDLAAADDGGLQNVDHGRSLSAALAPRRRIDHDRTGSGLSIGAERAGEGTDELAQRRLGLRCDRRCWAEQKEQCLRLGRAEPTEIGPGAADELPPAAASRLRIHRDTGSGERFQIAAGRGHRHFELVGQLGRGHPAASLHEQQGGHESICAHLPSLASKVLSR